eukprot:15452317-Alexandrium_andersonii.AAC.1
MHAVGRPLSLVSAGTYGVLRSAAHPVARRRRRVARQARSAWRGASAGPAQRHSGGRGERAGHQPPL